MTDYLIDLAERLARAYRLDIWDALEIACLLFDLGILERVEG